VQPYNLLSSFMQLLKRLISGVLFFHDLLTTESSKSSYFIGPNQ